MRVKVLRNVGRTQLEQLGASRTDLIEGAVVDVANSIAEKLIAVRLAEAVEVKGEAKSPEIKGEKAK